MEIRVPGDKSLSHRTIMLASLARGTSRVRGLLAGDDPQATADVFRALGVRVPALPTDGSILEITGAGLHGLSTPDSVLDARNSGTTARLLLGILAGQEGLEADLTGDASLRSRPMRRVTAPLALMGARFQELGEADRLPIRVHGGPLRSLDYPSPVASAQVKSAILLAGLTGGVPVQITEPRHSRDHTERLLSLMGCSVLAHPGEGGWRIELREPPEDLDPLDFTVPGDFSSAVFPLALALMGGGPEELVIRDVGLNPTRTGLLKVLKRMGAAVYGEPTAEHTAGEPRGTIVGRRSDLAAVDVRGEEIPSMVDEIPLLAVLAARAAGTTRITGAAELRVKESDRLRALALNLQAIGVEVLELEDGLEIRGGDGPLEGTVDAFHDHRIAMAFGVLAALPGNRIAVSSPGIVDVSFPGFWSLIREIAEMRASHPGTPSQDGGSAELPPVITLDGPAGSGKSSTARAVAEHLGFRHLDSGAIYRALTLALLERGIDPETWEALTEEDLRQIPVRVEPAGDQLEIYLGERRLEEELRSARVTGLVSRLAQLPAVRARLLDLQRQAGVRGGLVADGRDMGTVVFPDAELKFFLVADLKERARRRLQQEGAAHPTPAEVEAEAGRIQDRDARDARRSHSPLRKPEDAVELDTTRLSFEEQVEIIVRAARRLTGK